MLAGFGKVEITPPLGVELAGYGYYLERKATQVDDPLFVRAIYLKDTQDAAFIVSCDLLGLSQEVVQAVKTQIEPVMSDHALHTDIMIVSIHTHTGPAIKYHEGCGYPDPKYVQELPAKLVQACLMAMQNARTVTDIRTSYDALPEGIVYNRSAPHGPIDREIRGVFLHRLHASSICLASFACHPVCNGCIDHISADYPGALMSLLEQEGLDAIYLNGLCGDIDPRVDSNGHRLIDKTRMASRILEGLIPENTEEPLSMRCGVLPFSIPLRSVSMDDIHHAADHAVQTAGGEGQGAARVARLWEKQMTEHFQTLPSQDNCEAHYMLLGHQLILALPFEGFTTIGMQIRENLHLPHAIILGCAEELRGYLPSREDIRRGNYASLESTFLYKRLPVAEDAAAWIVSTLCAKLRPVLA